VAFVSDDWQTGYGSSQTVLEAILRYLALVNMTATAPPASKFANDGAVVFSLR